MVMKFLSSALLALALLCFAPAQLAAQISAPAPSEEASLSRVFAEDAAREDQLDPMSALYRGKKADVGALAQMFSDQLDRRRLASARQSLRALARVDRAKLNAERQVSYDVFRLAKQEQAAWLQPDIRMLTAVRPITHFGGLHVEFPTLMASGGALPFANESDYRTALALNGAFAQVLENAVARFRQGMADFGSRGIVGKDHDFPPDCHAETTEIDQRGIS